METKKMQHRSEKAMQNKKAYDREYAKKYFKQKVIVFNTLYPEDIALLDWIKQQLEGGNHYIRRLIMEDMEKRLA